MTLPDNEDQHSGASDNRWAHFQAGYDPAAASVLTEKPPTAPRPYRPDGLNQQFQRSANGMSAQDADRRFINQDTPGPSFNGSTPSQQSQLMNLRAIGAGDEA